MLLTGNGEDDATDKTVKTEDPETFTVTGTMSLTSSDLLGSGGVCFGSDGYDDINEGAQVVIRYADGKSVAVESSSPGHAMGQRM